jgi:hypothetical protein
METSLPTIKEAIIREIHASQKETAKMVSEVAEHARERRAEIHQNHNTLVNRVSILEAKAK